MSSSEYLSCFDNGCLQAYSDGAIEEMREQKEKGGVENMEMLGSFRHSKIIFCIEQYFSKNTPGAKGLTKVWSEQK